METVACSVRTATTHVHLDWRASVGRSRAIRVTGSNQPASRLLRFADVAGVLGAAFAALCCAGIPFIVGGLALLGLSFLKRDAILWPLMIASLLIALWGFWRGRQMHGKTAPFVVALLAAMVLVAGVIFVHGFPALEMIWASVVALIGATAWNIYLRRRMSAPMRQEALS
jgi:mercuric ion transport protein